MAHPLGADLHKNLSNERVKTYYKQSGDDLAGELSFLDDVLAGAKLFCWFPTVDHVFGVHEQQHLCGFE